MNKISLEKLTDFLQDKVADEQFDMRYYRSRGQKQGDCKYKAFSGLRPVSFFSKKDCGTMGCAMGWSPFVEGLEPIQIDFDRKLGHLNFRKYGIRIYGLDDEQYDYLFTPDNYPDWRNTTKKDVIDRILRFVN